MPPVQLVIDLPPRDQLLARNRSRWQEVLGDPNLLGLPYRIETNAHGTLLMTPPPSGGHSLRQGEIVYWLRSLLGGRALPECPISTIDGVRAADVGWYSEQRFPRVEGQIAFEIAPEICVEVLSPSNVQSEIQEKSQLYFEAGADKVWICELDGKMRFYRKSEPTIINDHSTIAPEFPPTIP